MRRAALELLLVLRGRPQPDIRPGPGKITSDQLLHARAREHPGDILGTLGQEEPDQPRRRRGRPALESDGGYGAIVREARKGKGVSLAGFSLRVGVSVSHLSRIERGRANPSLDAIETLADHDGEITVADNWHAVEEKD